MPRARPGYFTGDRPTLQHVHAELWALRTPIRWVQDDGSVVETPAGTRVNGASIPRGAWSLVGHPLEGPFLRPSGQHDDECARRVPAGSAEVHKRFYYALRAEGVGRVKAFTMYAAVRLFGPRWPRRTRP